MTMQKHYVTFYSPGTFVAETNEIEIDMWDVAKAMQLSNGIEQRYGAVPYGFRFTTRSRADDEFEPRETVRSPLYYLPHCKLETIDEVRKRADPDERILLSNMESNGWDKIVTTTKGWKWTQPFENDDVLLDGSAQ